MIKVCKHLKENEELDYVKFFTGKGKENFLICHNCNKLEDKTNLDLIEVIEEHEEWYFDAVNGRPEIIENIRGNMSFEHRIEEIEELKDKDILAVKAFNIEESFLFLTLDKKIIKVNFKSLKVEILNIELNKSINIEKYVELLLSDDDELLSIYNFMGQFAVIYDLKNMTELMLLDRGTYHEDVTPYTMGFIEREDTTFLITSTNWDKIDIINPYNQEILTKRDWKEIKDEDKEGGFYTEFRSSVYISPSKKWIVEDGWLWHPVGSIVRWELQAWFENKWEADKGKSLASLRGVPYSWGNAIEFLNDDKLLVWGYGNDDDYLVPAVVIYDLETCEEIEWFSGPDNNFILDKYLFTYTDKNIWGKLEEEKNGKILVKNNGAGILNVWDIEKGERIYKEENISPRAYNKISKEFLTMEENGVFKLSCLVEL